MADTLTRSLPKTPADWHALLAEHSRSGLSARAFCAAQGIPYHRFIYWRRKLASPSATMAASLASSPSEQRRTADAGTPAFIEIPVGQGPSPTPGWELELQLGSGLTLRLRSV